MAECIVRVVSSAKNYECLAVRFYDLVVRWLLACSLCAVAIAAQAVIETYEFSDVTLERRYHSLSDELRCPKCQNQTIADSNAPIAKDLRFLLHEQLESGASDDEILSFMVARYGEFVRYRPGLDSNTALLWYGPLLLTLVTLAALAMHLRGRHRATAPAEPTEEEREALRAQMTKLSGEQERQA